VKSSLLVALALLGSPVVASAAPHVGAHPNPALSEVLARAKKARKPVLLDFSAVWCVPCKMLAKELDKPENAKLLGGFVFQVYDGERGAGLEAAKRYDVHNYPTLLVLDSDGKVLVEQVGVEPTKLTAWLTTSAQAAVPTAELEKRLAKSPDDVATLWLLVRQAEARRDQAAARRWLARIESADKSEDRSDAALAGWQRLDSELTEKVRKQIVSDASDLLTRYPAQGLEAWKILIAAGVDQATLTTQGKRIVVAARDANELNSLVYVALGSKLYDVALAAAEKQLALTPQANAYDTLAEVYNYRGDKAKAIATQKQGLAHPTLEPSMKPILEENLRRFETGGPTSDVPPPGTMGSALAVTPARNELTPEVVAKRLFTQTRGLTAPCQAQAESLPEAYVRIKLGAKAIEKLEILEPAASPALKQCLDKALRAVAIPADTQAVTVVLPLKL
jgi:thiol-disulfide isomerase/thioredoxin